MFKWWSRILRFTLRGQRPVTLDEVPVWSVAVPWRLWYHPFRFDGRSFDRSYRAGLPRLLRPLIPLRLFYLAFLFFWPLVALWRSVWKGRQAPAYFRGCLSRPDLVHAHLDADFTPAEWAWSRPDTPLSMLAAWEFHVLRRDWTALENKVLFYTRAQEAGLPIPECLSIEEAIQRGGEWIVKDATQDLGSGVELLSAQELQEELPHLTDAEKKGIVVQPVLRNHATLRAVYPETAPLSTLRVTTQLDPATHQPVVSRCAVRMGRAGSVVDNTAQGGIWTNVQLSTGQLTAGVTKHSFGQYKDGKPLRYNSHPDTGLPFVGLKVPWWDEGRALAVRAHTLLAPDAPSMGWDIALWEERPVLLEVNVWTVVYDYDPQNDAFTPGCTLILQELKKLSPSPDDVRLPHPTR